MYFSVGRVISPTSGQPHAIAPKNRIKPLQNEKVVNKVGYKFESFILT